MIIAFPLVNENELSFEFKQSKMIAFYNVSTSVLDFELTDKAILEDEKSALVRLMQAKQVKTVVSPYYHFETLKNLKVNGIDSLQSKGRQLSLNISCCLSDLLLHFDVSESFIVASCGTTCAECTLPCKG